MLIEFTITTRGQVHSLNAVPKGATITFVDGKECIARCEGCGKPILEGDKCFCDPEGVYLCSSCENSLINEGIGGVEPSAIFKDEVIAFSCGFCGAPLNKDKKLMDVPDVYNPDDYPHDSCGRCQAEAESWERPTVSHDMALDAEDPSLEGQRI